MNEFGFPILSLIVFLPFLGALIILFWKNASDEVVRSIALITSVVVFLISTMLYGAFNSGAADPQFVEKVAWIPSIGADYSIGIDGLSLFLVLLTTFLTPACVLISWKDIHKR